METPQLVDKNFSGLQKMTKKIWHSCHIGICQHDDVQNKRSLGMNLSQLKEGKKGVTTIKKFFKNCQPENVNTHNIISFFKTLKVSKKTVIK